MSKLFHGKERIEMLGYDIIHIIAEGNKENFNILKEQIKKCSVIRYLMNKYKEGFFLVTEEGVYDIDDWEKVLGEYSYLEMRHDVQRKMGIGSEEDGLLVLLNIILQITAER